MRLAKAANYFNRMACTDAYSGAAVFKGQLGLYDDNKRDSETAERRVLSLSPDAIIPVRRVIAAAGSRWIIGHANPDDFNGSTIRVGYTVHEAPLLARYRTLEQVCLQRLGTEAYIGRAWVKDRAYTEHSAELNTQYHLHFSTFEAVAVDHLVSVGDHWYLVRATNPGAGGTLVALAEEMPAPELEVAKITSGAWDPVTETLGGPEEIVNVVRVRWQSLFEYRTELAPKFKPGDLQLAIAQSAMAISAGARVELSDGLWQVESAIAHKDVWLCRAVRHA
jgi:hypothetical protein